MRTLLLLALAVSAASGVAPGAYDETAALASCYYAAAAYCAPAALATWTCAPCTAAGSPAAPLTRVVPLYNASTEIDGYAGVAADGKVVVAFRGSETALNW